METKTTTEKTDVLCEDPCRQGCTDVAEYYRPKGYPDQPDQVEYICGLCFAAKEIARDIDIQEGRTPSFDPSEWTWGEWVEV